MTVNSMTGFARIEGVKNDYRWVWEAKSVNSKGFDIRFRLPRGFDEVETVLRRAAAKTISRGNLFVFLNLQRPQTAPTLNINRHFLEQLICLAEEYRGAKKAINIEQLLMKSGVIEFAEDNDDKEIPVTCQSAILESFNELMQGIASVRLQEGEELTKITIDHIREISSLIEEAAKIGRNLSTQYGDRLRENIKEILDDNNRVPEERLAQEIALIVAKGDIREEIDRMAAHVKSANRLLSNNGPIGRQLDFLCQEFNREANTLCSKSNDIDLTKVGLSLKLTIEQLREQTQNIE
ncbi:MAG: YicC/YloC family endoribonuclease [Pseudomonadota bacterium]|nr:YicC/YloC family endoribonuclease [Pseudomonadota bacterium]